MPESKPPIYDPLAEYRGRLADRTASAEQLERSDRRIADARLLVFLGTVALAFVAFRWEVFHPAWLLVPVSGFVGLLIASDGVRRKLDPARKRVAYYQGGIDRLEDRWAGRGEQGTRFAPDDHPFDLDLDLFGPGSMFERLCAARTESGQRELASWLLVPATPGEIGRRQAAVEELRRRIDLREDLSILGDGVQAGLSPASLVSWGEAPARLNLPWLPPVLVVMAVVNLSALAWWGVRGQPLPFFLAAAISGGIAKVLGKQVAAALEEIARKADELRLLAALLGRVESEPFEAAWLLDLRHGMETDGIAPSRRIGRLAFLAGLLDYRRNQLFLPLALQLFWTTQIAFAVERWRARSGHKIAGWLDAVGRFEAISSLASYAFESPADPFPEIVEAGEPQFRATGLGHPLLPPGQCVRNDLALGGLEGPRILLVTGSNMSGKSTMLRTVGINAVLAQAGAPVHATALKLSPLAIGATLRVQDSLQAGRSRFFAEITRLRQVVDLSRGPLPLLFLLDEILHGTNSHDRLAGAEALLRSLAGTTAIGLVTTHDLALAEIVTKLGVPAANVHFEDHLEGGKMTFDYIMRPGVVAKSNALELMRAIGLDV
jgi:hypothetical protein